MAKTKKVSKIKIKKKRWFPIFAPKFLGQREIGESYLSEPNVAMGRVVKINLRDLTRNMRDQNIYVSLKITEVNGNNLDTEIVGYAYMPFFVKKLIRVRTGKIDDSFVLKTKDNKIVRLKPLAITVFPVKKSVKTAIRKQLREMLEEEVAKLNFDSLINDLLRYKLQMEFKKKLNKLCPVREVIMRMVKLEEGKRLNVKWKGEEKKQTVEVKVLRSEASGTPEAKPLSEKKEEKKAEIPPVQPQPPTEKPAKKPVKEVPPTPSRPPLREGEEEKK